MHVSLSVIIPVHNAAAYLAQTLATVLQQTRLPDEIIVLDDRSKDESLAIARAFGAYAPDLIRVVEVGFGNAAKTRNRGAIEATGQQLMFLDADDLIAADSLAELETTLQTDGGGIATCPWYRLQQEEGRWIVRSPSCAPRERDATPLAGWLTGWYHPPCSILWTRHAFETAGRWDERGSVNDDGDLMMRALISGADLAFTAKGAGFYRRLPEGQVSLSGKRFQKSSLEARLLDVEKAVYWLKQRGRLDPYRAEAAKAFALIAKDSEASSPEVHAAAVRQSRICAPSKWSRLKSTPRPDRRQCHPNASVPIDRSLLGQELTIGTELASAVTCQQLSGKHAFSTSPHHTAKVVCSGRPPAVSIIVPTYNRGDLLPKTLNSVLSQTYSQFELLIVDDGSIDNTKEVVASYGDSRIRYLEQPCNRGVSAARNRGLRESKGDYIAFLDSDDEWFPDKLKLQVDLFRNASDSLGLVYTGVESNRGTDNPTVQLPTYRGNLYRKLLLTNVIHGGGSNALIRRRVVAAVGMFDEDIPAIEDYDYWLRTARFFDIDFVSQPLIRYNDVPAVERKSLNQSQNVDARNYFYNKHRDEMLQAGVAHLFLLESARRVLRSSKAAELKPILELIVAAARDKPTSLRPYRLLAKIMGDRSRFGSSAPRVNLQLEK